MFKMKNYVYMCRSCMEKFENLKRVEKINFHGQCEICGRYRKLFLVDT